MSKAKTVYFFSVCEISSSLNGVSLVHFLPPVARNEHNTKARNEHNKEHITNQKTAEPILNISDRLFEKKEIL